MRKEDLIPVIDKEIKHNKIVSVIVTVHTILLIIFILMMLCHTCCPECPCWDNEIPGPSDQFDPSEDPDIEWGDRPTVPQEEIQENLNNQVEQGMMNISMNTNPVFENGKAKGNLLITNESMNRYPQVVQIFRDDTGELIYTSGAIPVGARVDNSKLDVNLKAGIYECTAHFNQIDENGKMIGKACAKIIVYVLS